VNRRAPIKGEEQHIAHTSLLARFLGVPVDS